MTTETRFKFIGKVVTTKLYGETTVLSAVETTKTLQNWKGPRQLKTVAKNDSIIRRAIILIITDRMNLSSKMQFVTSRIGWEK